MKNQRMNGRRLTLALLLSMAIVAVFVVRLVDLQVVQAEELNATSLNKRAIGVTTYGMRGDILDANGVVLAGSVLRYDIPASPKNALLYDGTFTRYTTDADGKSVGTKVTVLEALTEITDIAGGDPEALYISLAADPDSDYLMLAKNLTTEQYYEVRDLKIPWIYPVSKPTRTYPNGAVAGNLVGFMGTDRALNGVEYTYNECLAGVDGSSTYERGLDGVRLPGSTVVTTPAVDGGSIQLTIDSDLQWYVAQQLAERSAVLGAESASAAVVRVKDAHLMAMVDWPGVDPNNVDGTPMGNWGSLAFSAVYEQGSTFKPLTAAMLIEEGKATPNTQVEVPGVYHTPEGGTVRDAFPHGDWRLTLTGVLEQSSNVGISKLATRLPNSVRYDYFTKFGIGSETAVGFQGEEPGILASTWDTQQMYDVAYGQGVAATLAQMASAYQALANNGVRLPLTLVTGCTSADGTVTAPETPDPVRVVSESAADQVVAMMESVVTGGSLSSELTIPGYRVAAKTGTGEIAVGGVYTNDRIVSVVGMAPAENPEYVVIVSFVKPVTIKTSAAAAPTFRAIMTQTLKSYRVLPSTQPAPNLPTTW